MPADFGRCDAILFASWHSSVNATAASFMKTLQTEKAYLTGCETFEDGAALLPRFIDEVYNSRRLRLALAYRSPAEFKPDSRGRGLTSDGRCGPAQGDHSIVDRDLGKG